MTVSKTFLCFVCIAALSGCSKNSGGSGVRGFFGTDTSSPSNPVTSMPHAEMVKLQEAVKSEPVYKIEDAEIELLQKEGIITETDVSQLQAIK